jgi:hypothetical protein
MKNVDNKTYYRNFRVGDNTYQKGNLSRTMLQAVEKVLASIGNRREIRY